MNIRRYFALFSAIVWGLLLSADSLFGASPVGLSCCDWRFPSGWRYFSDEEKMETVWGVGVVLPPCGGCGNVNGVLLNTALIGGQIGHFSPIGDLYVNGISIGIFGNVCGSGNGLMVAPVNCTENANGLQVGLINTTEHANGITVGLANYAFEANGIMIGVYNRVGFEDVRESSSVFQIGIVNHATGCVDESSFDIQVGVWNILAEGARGMQFGLVNSCEKSSIGCDLLPLFNMRW